MVEKEVKLKFEAAGANEVADATAKIGRSFQRTARDSKELEKSGKSLSGAFENLGTKILLLPQALLNAGRVIKNVAETISNLTIGIIESGGSIADTVGSFNKLIEKGVDTAKVLEQLRVATQGQVTDFELMKLALGSLGGETGITVDQLSKLVQAIFVTGKGLNRELSPALEAMRRSLATGSLTTLAAVEGFENITKVLERAKLAAREHGTRIDRLTLLHLGLTEALKQADRQIDQFADVTDSAGDRLTRFQTQLQNMIDRFKLAVVVSPRLNDAMADLEKFMQAAFGSTEDLATILGGKFGDALGYIIELIPKGVALFEDIRSGVLSFGSSLLLIPEVGYKVTDALLDIITLGLKPLAEWLGIISVEEAQFVKDSREMSDRLLEQSTQAASNAARFDAMAESIRKAREESNRAASEIESTNGKLEIEAKVTMDDSVERTIEKLKRDLGDRAAPVIRQLQEQALLNAQATQ